ncbi:MAG: four helix bundle protein [Gemmatimonadaceae bacterium]|nr:four helix bundle protein [Gemmatimonadaceae bacterium]
MHDFRRLVVWERAKALGVEIHLLVGEFPRADRGVLGGQLRRAALSISANIAEGCGKSSRAESARFFQIAAGSASETEHHLIVAGDLGFLDKRRTATLQSEAIAVQRMLRSLIRFFTS